jgi:TolB-like protein/Flp pilus assembly protein TadD
MRHSIWYRRGATQRYGMEGLLERARQRGLDRAAAIYAIAAWVAVQTASVALPDFAAPAWVLPWLIALAIAGFPLVLAAAWYAGGRDRPGRTAAEPAPRRRVDFTFVALLATIMAVSVIQAGFWFWRREPPAPTAHLVPVVQEASVAVLPFVNMSGDPAKEYFSDGISEEVLNALADTPRLRVAARMSSFAFKGKNTDILEIARRLHVRTVVEGSVREDGTHVRIAAQLIDAADGLHLWSQTFDRDLTDILLVQHEIARAISRALTDRLRLPSEQQTAAIDPQAYRSYLQARDDFHRGSLDDLERAAKRLKTVTELAPAYANGYAALSAVLRTMSDRFGRTDAMAPAEAAARQALSLDPENIEALAGLTVVLLDSWRWQEALDTFRKAEALNPGNAEVLRLRAIVAHTFNFPDADIAAERKTAELDPLQPKIRDGIARWYWNNGRFDEAGAAMQQVLALRRGNSQDLDQQCAIEAGRKNVARARAIAGELSEYFALSPQNLLTCAFYTAIAEGDRNRNRARAIADAAAADAEKNGGSYTTIGDAYRQLGDLESAMPWYERAFAARDSALLLVPDEGWQTPEPLVSYPPWKALWARRPIQDWLTARLAAGRLLEARS